MATAQSQTVVSNVFFRVYAAMAALFVMLILYRVVAFVLVRRLRHAEHLHSAEAAAAGRAGTAGHDPVRDYLYAEPVPARGNGPAARAAAGSSDGGTR
jgi:hypothetical protein